MPKAKVRPQAAPAAAVEIEQEEDGTLVKVDHPEQFPLATAADIPTPLRN